MDKKEKQYDDLKVYENMSVLFVLLFVIVIFIKFMFF
jgi:hypothetical protein